MNKKEKRLSIVSLVLSIFFFLFTGINFASGHIGTAVSGLGAGIFYLALSSNGFEKQRRKAG